MFGLWCIILQYIYFIQYTMAHHHDQGDQYYKNSILIQLLVKNLIKKLFI